jgi:nucleoside-diphosphate-sugar epimerase
MKARYADARPGDVKDSQADIAALRAVLPYAPQFDLEDGLRRTYDWYRTHSADR